MSTNKTPNYDLHSWVPQDDFHMTEINENFTKLDTALKTEATAAAQGRSALQTALSGQISQLDTALQSEVTTRTQQMGTKANASTVTALSQQLASRPRMVFGTYTGNGTADRLINLGAAVAAVLVEDAQGRRPDYAQYIVFGGLALEGSPTKNNAVVVTQNGFKVSAGSGDSGKIDLRANLKNEVYHYAAWLKS